MTYMHIGKDFTPPDVEGKVTGAARYAEDFKKDGMVFARLLGSPIPAGRVVNIDASAALAIPGVLGIFTADDLPPAPPPANPALAKEWVTYIGQPILAVAAESDALAEEALSKIVVEYQRRPFVVDPLDTLTEGGPDPYPSGNTLIRNAGEAAAGTTASGTDVGRIKWSIDQVAAFRAGREPVDAQFGDEWSYGDVAARFAECSTIIEEPFVTIGQPHHSLESRTGMAYWENGKCYFHGSLQSHTVGHDALSAMLEIDPANLVFINENTGGGFGSKIFPYPMMAVTGKFARKLNRPVQLRITRAEEFYIGSARSGMQGWIKIGLKDDGRVGAVDVAIVNDAGSGGGGSASSSAEHISIMFQPEAMRFRGLAMYTNTTPRGAQRGPGQNEMAAVLAPMIDKAANLAGVDRVAMRRLNAPRMDGKIGGRQGGISSSYMPEAIDKAAQMFNWDQKKALPRQISATKVRGIGVGQGFHTAGANGYDGLIRIASDGTIYLHTGVGNLGTYSYAGVLRAAAETLQCSWDNCVVVHGHGDLNLPHSTYQGGSNTMFTETRSSHVAALDVIQKLKEIAASEFGGSADDYSIGGERVFLTSNESKGMSYGEAAQKAIEMGGKYSGMEYPDDIHRTTVRSVQAMQGTGLIGVAKDTLPRSGAVPGMAIAFVEIELDKETGKFDIVDYTAVAECGTVVHPKGLRQAMNGGGIWGFGMAAYERHVYDPQNGLPANVGLYQSKPPTYLDVPVQMNVAGNDMPDPQSPVGARGIGEPAQGCAVAALMSAIADALDGHLFNRTPVTADMIINHVAQNGFNTGNLKTNTF
ncbi:MAG: xanthine dehydrogenase family protein molybdopterin-binding subunit [Pseudomonadales bacterium]|nr:xanthine dehydrogenase family protein molybdopterin-binding subunit [Pseudomonadales bacterium]MCP5344036.1 xanthine dehydrogenase family protein molybdopterin-binding subunit [Pseudomonadales bacterium]